MRPPSYTFIQTHSNGVINHIHINATETTSSGGLFCTTEQIITDVSIAFYYTTPGRIIAPHLQQTDNPALLGSALPPHWHLPTYMTPSLVFRAASSTPALVFSAAATTPSLAIENPFISTSILDAVYGAEAEMEQREKKSGQLSVAMCV